MAAEGPPDAETGAEGTGRLEAFSDGVFAIAITLLVLELRPPELGEGQSGFADTFRALGHLWPEYLAYVVSFLTIANAWMSHHSIFRLIARTDQTLVYLNTLLLLVVAFIPFPTALISEYQEDGAERAATFVYGATFTLLAAVYALLWWYAAHGRRLVAPGTPQADLDLIRRRIVFTVPLYLAAALLSLLLPGWETAPILLVSILYPLSFPIEGGRRPRA
jgi:uncharacterized membrane protein